MLRHLVRTLSLTLLVAGSSMAMAQPAPRPPQDRQQARPHQPAPRQPDRHQPTAGQPYGQWNNGWGQRPPAPPKHWSRRGDWYRHVRACQQRFRSYDPRTDTYVVSRGNRRRCTL